MTLKEIEKDLKEYTGGSSFIRIGQLSSYLGQKNRNRVKEKYTKDAFKLDGSPSYFIPDIAKNIFRAGLTILVTLSLLTSSFPVDAAETIDFDGQGFEIMYCTAYCVGEITANGSKVHEGGCACNPRLGQVAIVYTLGGEYIGLFECNDTGKTNGLKKGTVIDIYRNDYDRCVDLMKLVGKSQKVYVKWIDGKG